MKGYLTIGFILICSFELVGQGFNEGITANISKNPTHVIDKTPSRERILFLIKNNPRNTLVGNKCMDQVTQEMGFRYLLQPKGQPGNRNEIERLLHNFSVKVNLVFKNGPFWKSKLKKKREECMSLTGDYTG